MLRVLKSHWESHRERCGRLRPCRRNAPTIFFSPCRKENGPRPGQKKRALLAAKPRPCGLRFACLRELLVRTASGILQVPYRVRYPHFRAEVLSRIWQLGYSIGAVDEKSHATSPVRSAPLRTTRAVRETSIFRQGSGSGVRRTDFPQAPRKLPQRCLRGQGSSACTVRRTRQKTAGLGGISHQPLPPAK